MRIPKYRAWLKEDKLLLPVESISFKGNSFEPTFEPNPKISNMTQEIKLMESTGLIDEKRKEIYVGDIIRDDKGFIALVVYDNKYGSFCLVYNPSSYINNYSITFKEIRDKYQFKYEVIGNMYMNPELLEK